MYSLKRRLFLSDLNYVYEGVGVNWLKLKGQTLLITGGTGIIGKWLLATILHADDILNLGIKIFILSRNPEVLKEKYPELFSDERVFLIRGDVRTFNFPDAQDLSYVIHAATDVISDANPTDLLDVCFAGTKNVLNQSSACGLKKMLVLSSGAVYGKVPSNLGPIPEDYIGPISFQDPESAYAEGKRISELLCSIECKNIQQGITIARCFAMVGPYLPLDKHFAIGNFINSVIAENDININGDGTPIRSYLYLADVVLRLWILLLNGKSAKAYNVGSDIPIMLSELAKLVIKVTNSKAGIVIRGKNIHGAHANLYYPDTSIIKTEFGLSSQISLEEAIIKTEKWYRLNKEGGYCDGKAI